MHALWFIVATTTAGAGSAGADLRALPTVEVTYEVAFDLGPLADKTCRFTGVCDCAAKYHGAGQVTGVDGDRVTFAGTWKLTDGTCQESFLFWSAGDGPAYHTVRFNPDHTAITEWIAHADPAKKDRLSTDIKAGQQVWLAEMSAPWDAKTRTAIHAESETQEASGLPITSTHALTLSFGTPPD